MRSLNIIFFVTLIFEIKSDTIWSRISVEETALWLDTSWRSRHSSKSLHLITIVLLMTIFRSARLSLQTPKLWLMSRQIVLRVTCVLFECEKILGKKKKRKQKKTRKNEEKRKWKKKKKKWKETQEKRKIVKTWKNQKMEKWKNQ